MWRPWSRAFEALGRIRFMMTQAGKLKVGDPAAPDAGGGTGWKAYVETEKLYDLWGPVPESPWVPFHCVPLFAALDRIPKEDIGPTRVSPQPTQVDEWHEPPTPLLPAHASPGAPAPPWLTDGTWTILDLPGATCVEAAVWLITSGRCQPVCTFDNWPHVRGVLRPEQTLAALLRWATTVAEVRPELTATSPPLWICDSERLGTQPGSPGQFDNRYYLDDSILPGPGLLRRVGIHRVVYVTAGTRDVPTLDLESYFADLLTAGLSVLHLDLSSTEALPVPFAAPREPRRVPSHGFRRSAAGGFGTEVPQPSSGSSG